jgi:hypothetical protein
MTPGIELPISQVPAAPPQQQKTQTVLETTKSSQVPLIPVTQAIMASIMRGKATLRGQLKEPNIAFCYENLAASG